MASTNILTFSSLNKFRKLEEKLQGQDFMALYIENSQNPMEVSFKEAGLLAPVVKEITLGGLPGMYSSNEGKPIITPNSIMVGIVEIDQEINGHYSIEEFPFYLPLKEFYRGMGSREVQNIVLAKLEDTFLLTGYNRV